MKPGKRQSSKQRCQDLCWKIHDPAQSFVLRSYTMHELRIQKFLLVSSSVRSKQLLCFVHSKGQKREQKHTTKHFVGFHNHSPLLTFFSLYQCTSMYVLFLISFLFFFVILAGCCTASVCCRLYKLISKLHLNSTVSNRSNVL